MGIATEMKTPPEQRAHYTPCLLSINILCCLQLNGRCVHMLLNGSVLFVFLVCSAHANDDVRRRRETLALFHGFLCYIKGESLEECKTGKHWLRKYISAKGLFSSVTMS